MEATELMKEVAEQIERTANVRAVFGSPVGEGMDMIIPVARVAVRAGGGGGTGDIPAQGGIGTKGKGSGMGLGMKIDSAPVGYIKRTPDGAIFMPTVDRNRAFIIAAGVAIVGLTVLGVGLRLAGKR